MDQLTLYRTVGALNRVALGDLADGVEYFTATKTTEADGSQTGAILLTPVRIADGATKRAEPQAVHDPFNSLPQE